MNKTTVKILNENGKVIYTGVWSSTEDYSEHTAKARVLNLANDIYLFTNDGYNLFGSFEDSGVILETDYELHFEGEKYKAIITEYDTIAELL